MKLRERVRNTLSAGPTAAPPEAQFVEPRILRESGRLDKLASPNVTAKLNMKVQKSGRTTGWTQGAVDLVGVTVNVNYAPPPAPHPDSLASTISSA